MTKPSFFHPDEMIHVYQNTRNGALIFYSVSDYLVYFTIVSTTAQRCGVQIVGICLMVDHVHLLVHAAQRADLERFIQRLDAHFVREYNASSGRNGPLFNARFGWAVKRGFKQIRTTIAYLLNNPVEKKLCKKAEDYQWNFLSYGYSRAPFSAPIALRNASKPFRRACRMVDSTCRNGQSMNYSLLRLISAPLSSEERKQLTDYTIRKYNPIDYQKMTEYYGDFSSMLTAVHANTGSEFELREDTLGGDDSLYRQITSYLRKKEGIADIRSLLASSEEQRLRLAGQIRRHVPGISEKQVRKYLQLPINKP